MQKANYCPLSNVLKKSIDAMFAVTERPDVFNDETPLFSSSMASICEWIEHASNDQLQLIQGLLERLFRNVFPNYAREPNQTLRDTKVDGLSGLINTCINRLERRIAPQIYPEILKMYLDAMAANIALSSEGITVLCSLLNYVEKDTVKQFVENILKAMEYGATQIQDQSYMKMTFTTLTSLIENQLEQSAD